MATFGESDGAAEDSGDVLLQRGRYRVRLASGPEDLARAQALRGRAFLGPDGPADVDAFDPLCRHVLIEEVGEGTLFACFRYLWLDDGAAIIFQITQHLGQRRMLMHTLHPILPVPVQRALGLLCFDGYVHGIDSPDDSSLSTGIAPGHVLTRDQASVVVAMRALRAHSDTA